MSYFLFVGKLETGRHFDVIGEEVDHLQARRVRPGEVCNFQDETGRRFACRVADVSKRRVTINPLRRISVPPEPQVNISLFQSVINEQAFDFILQKATELGAARITLFNAQRTGTKLAREKYEKKSSRWNKILWEAAKQCDRVKPPSLEYLESLEELIKASRNLDRLFVLDIAGSPIKDRLNYGQSFNSCAILIGPEGGLTLPEIKKLKSLPTADFVSLGPFLLRAETAALAALSVIRCTAEP